MICFHNYKLFKSTTTVLNCFAALSCHPILFARISCSLAVVCWENINYWIYFINRFVFSFTNYFRRLFLSCFFFVFLYFLFMSLLSFSSFVVFAFSLLFRTAAGWGYVGVRGTSLALCRTAREKLNTYVFKETLLQIGRNAPFAHRPETRPTTVIYCTGSTHTFQFLFHFISFYKIRILIPSSSSLFIAFHFFFFFLSLFYFSSSLLSPINWSPLIRWQYDFARVFLF